MSQAADSLISSEGLFRTEVLHWAEMNPGTVILESNPGDSSNRTSYLFCRPLETIVARSVEEVEPALKTIDQALKDGYYAAGCLTYEAGYALEKRFHHVDPGNAFLLWFGLYEAAISVDRRSGHVSGPKTILHELKNSLRQTRPPVPPPKIHFRPSISENQYLEAFNRIQRYIEAGDSYQVNLTLRLFSSVSAPTYLLYERMRSAQRVSYGAFVNTGRRMLLSCSPELFFRRSGDRITLKPMKGTIARGRTLTEDEEQKAWLIGSEKNRAENLMIVDLLRNDIGRIALPGSVKVGKFFEVERYETVFQATSTIEAKLEKGTGLRDIVRALFPSGSVTGAPKIRTMEIIRELETGTRGVYTGSIGFCSPSNKAVFNVAIRTLMVEKEDGYAEFGVGSGVVHDSRGKDEFQECLLKARFLQEDHGEFHLIETIRWDPRGGWFLLNLHTKRLKDSAKYFGFRYQADRFRDLLRKEQEALRARRIASSFMVRVALKRDGSFGIERSRVSEFTEAPFVRFSSVPIDPSNKFLYHKTTNRTLYEDELTKAVNHGFFDVLFQNLQGEITEGARSNIVIRRGDTWLTPPLECGILPGTYRSHLLSSKKHSVREQRLLVDDIMSADVVYVCNAVRGLVKVIIPQQSMIA